MECKITEIKDSLGLNDTELSWYLTFVGDFVSGSSESSNKVPPDKTT